MSASSGRTQNYVLFGKLLFLGSKSHDPIPLRLNSYIKKLLCLIPTIQPCPCKPNSVSPYRPFIPMQLVSRLRKGECGLSHDISATQKHVLCELSAPPCTRGSWNIPIWERDSALFLSFQVSVMNCTVYGSVFTK
jgi:hypothetical protein